MGKLRLLLRLAGVTKRQRPVGCPQTPSAIQLGGCSVDFPREGDEFLFQDPCSFIRGWHFQPHNTLFLGGKKSNPVLKPIFSVQGEHGWCSPNSSGKFATAGKVLWGWKERGKSYGTTLGTIFTNSGCVVGSISPFSFPFNPVFLIDLGLTNPMQERWSEAVWLQTQRCEEFTEKPVGKRSLHHRGELKILLFLRNKSPAPCFLSKHGVDPLWETLSFSPKYLTSLPCLLPSRPS